MLKFFVKLVVLLLAVAAGRFAYVKGLELPLFALNEVVVTGNWKVSQDSILAITGLEKGKSVYKQDLKYAASRLMRQSGVVQCSLKRGYFSTININVTLAEPALLVNSGTLNALSREGMVLPMDSKLPVLPLVSGRRFSSVRCYEHLKDPDITYALETYDALMATSPALSTRLSEINFGDDNALRLYLSPGGTEVLLDKSDIRDGIKRLAAMADSGLVSDTAVFDLRFGPVMVESGIGRDIL
jgi:cell division septal protein FtsQ